jgi:hypothetical protein
MPVPEALALARLEVVVGEAGLLGVEVLTREARLLRFVEAVPLFAESSTSAMFRCVYGAAELAADRPPDDAAHVERRLDEEQCSEDRAYLLDGQRRPLADRLLDLLREPLAPAYESCFECLSCFHADPSTQP